MSDQRTMPLLPGFKPNTSWAPPLKYWPPRAHRKAHPVALGQDWAWIAREYGIPDVWDLIFFNFETEYPPEVNHYLRQHVGCWHPAPDQRNFQFTNYDYPGKVYIPPRGYTRGPGMEFHRNAVAQLDKAKRNYPAIRFGHFQVSGSELNEVITAFRSGRAFITRDEHIATPAEWRYRDDVMAVKDANLTSWMSRNCLVHEATHAIVDHRKYFVFGWENELLAYTAQAVWGRKTDNIQAERHVRPDLIVNSVWHYAYVLARYLLATGDGIMHIESVDSVMPDYRDTTRTLNPVADLRVAIFNAYNPVEMGKRYKFKGIGAKG